MTVERTIEDGDWRDLPEIQKALQGHDVVAIVSGVTDFREAQALLEDRLPGRWQRLEWGMGSAENRSRFHQLQTHTGFQHLPMFIGREGLIGGLLELRQFLSRQTNRPDDPEPSRTARQPQSAAAEAVSRIFERELPSPATVAGPSGKSGKSVDFLLYKLGFAGLIPFVFLGLFAWLPPAEWRVMALQGLAAYAAVILSFLGAVHWGLYLRSAQHQVLALPAPYWAVTPSILAWIALLLPLQLGLPLLTALFPIVLVVDRVALARSSMPPGYLKLRGYLTLIAVISLVSGSILAV